MRGIMSIDDALNLADEAGLDLVNISPNADPPVCKILDYGKYRYEQQKKRRTPRKISTSRRSRRSGSARQLRITMCRLKPRQLSNSFRTATSSRFH